VLAEVPYCKRDEQLVGADDFVSGVRPAVAIASVAFIERRQVVVAAVLDRLVCTPDSDDILPFDVLEFVVIYL